MAWLKKDMDNAVICLTSCFYDASFVHSFSVRDYCQKSYKIFRSYLFVFIKNQLKMRHDFVEVKSRELWSKNRCDKVPLHYEFKLFLNSLEVSSMQAQQRQCHKLPSV